MKGLDSIILQDIKEIANSLGGTFEIFLGKKILITGGNGFLPSYLVDTLLHLNETILVQNPAKIFILTRRPPEKNYRLLRCLDNPSVEFIIGDVSHKCNMPSGLDYIIHAASKGSPKDYIRDPLDTMDANVFGTRKLLDYAKDNPVKGFLFISTGEVYGDADIAHFPIKEDYFGNVNQIGPRSSLQESKRFGETLCYTFWKLYGVPAKIIRPFHTYGPRIFPDDGRVIPEFMRRGFKGEDLEIIRGGSSIRTFCYISDMINAMWRVLLLGKPGEAYNAASEEEISIKDLANLVAGIFGNAVKIKSVGQDSLPNLVDTPQKTTPDISKIKKELGYAGSIPLEAGLKRLKQWYEFYGNIQA